MEVSLEETRNQQTLKYLNAFYTLQGDQSNSCSCGWNARYFHEVVSKQGMVLNKIMNQELSLFKIMAWTSGVTSPNHLSDFNTCRAHHSFHWEWTGKFKERFKERFIQGTPMTGPLRDINRGLCLACIRGDGCFHTKQDSE